MNNNASKPWVSNYPTLLNWLHKIEARCMEQIPVGSARNPTAYLEKWVTPNGRVFVVEVRANRAGWNIYTDANTSHIELTLADAEKRLGITS